jgi:DNA-binding transcriptional MocR family regulator
MLIAAHLLESGALSGIVAKQKAELSARQALLARELHAFAVNSHPTSTHAWLKLPPPWTAKSFVSTARIRGVALLGSEMFSLRDEGRQEAVRLNVGAPRSREDLGRALRILRDILMSADGNLGGRF